MAHHGPTIPYQPENLTRFEPGGDSLVADLAVRDLQHLLAGPGVGGLALRSLRRAFCASVSCALSVSTLWSDTP